MISVLGVVCAWIVHRWLPVTAHARLVAVTGRGAATPLDSRIAAWREQRRKRAHGQPETTRLLQMLVGELAAGIPTRDAFTGVLGADIQEPSALLAAPPTADAHTWRDVAHVWAASERAGLSMAVALQRIHAYALTDQEVAREVQANAAAPRFAIMTLAVLPVVAWVTASGTGAAPLRFLFQTVAGWVCLVVGVLLFTLAAVWMRALTRSALT